MTAVPLADSLHAPCGPLAVSVDCEEGELRARAAEMLALYTARWNRAEARLHIRLYRTGERTAARGSYVTAGRMRVDAADGRILASTPSGAWGRGTIGRGEAAWEIGVPARPDEKLQRLDVEHLLELAWSTSWRQCGWLPVHAAVVIKHRACVLLCAPSNGGKSTLTALLVQRGWKTLGDDKVLLRMRDGFPVARALHHTLNVPPDAQTWLGSEPRVADFAAYSVSCEKRAVPITAIDAGAACLEALPTHVAEISRAAVAGLHVSAVPASDAAPMLLRRIVIPSDRAAAAGMLGEAMRIGNRLSPIRVEIADDAYACSGWDEPLEALAV